MREDKKGWNSSLMDRWAFSSLLSLKDRKTVDCGSSAMTQAKLSFDRKNRRTEQSKEVNFGFLVNESAVLFVEW